MREGVRKVEGGREVVRERRKGGSERKALYSYLPEGVAPHFYLLEGVWERFLPPGGSVGKVEGGR